MSCRHIWQPYADANRIWQQCIACGIEEHVTTHREQRMRMLQYVMELTEPTSGQSE